MNAYKAFVKKEWMEWVRTYKLLIMAAVFLMLGIMGPLSARYLPELMKSMMAEVVNITLPPPSERDAWEQFFKNVCQIGLIVFVLALSGTLAGEYTAGTLTHLVPKGLSRRSVILAKATMAGTVWTGAYLLCFGASLFYTRFFWEPGIPVIRLALAVLGLWLFGIFLISAVLLGGALFRSTYACLLFTGGVVAVQFLVNLLPSAGAYLPLALATQNMPLIRQTAEPTDLLIPFAVTMLLTALFLWLACRLLRRKAL